jgi:prepilin-type N-terminal cleavage/methylation domain-containing protein
MKRGFSLVELLVSVALFSIVMLVSTGALLSLINANRKAQALHSVMSNLNVALDSLVRSARMGRTFHCGGGTYTDPQSCATGDTIFAFEPYLGSSSDSSDNVVFSYRSGEKRLYRSTDSGATFFPMTAEDVQIDETTFYVTGAGTGDGQQPKVVMVIKGTAGAERASSRTTFNIEATAIQRALDI